MVFSNEKLVYESIFGKLAAESTGISQRYIIHLSMNMYIGGSEMEGPQCFLIQLIVLTNDTLAVKNGYIIISTKLLTIQQQLGHVYGETQLSVNNYRYCK
jgi:hypothetical protein